MKRRSRSLLTLAVIAAILPCTAAAQLTPKQKEKAREYKERTEGFGQEGGFIADIQGAGYFLMYLDGEPSVMFDEPAAAPPPPVPSAPQADSPPPSPAPSESPAPHADTAATPPAAAPQPKLVPPGDSIADEVPVYTDMTPLENSTGTSASTAAASKAQIEARKWLEALEGRNNPYEGDARRALFHHLRQSEGGDSKPSGDAAPGPVRPRQQADTPATPPSTSADAPPQPSPPVPVVDFLPLPPGSQFGFYELNPDGSWGERILFETSPATDAKFRVSDRTFWIEFNRGEVRVVPESAPVVPDISGTPRPLFLGMLVRNILITGSADVSVGNDGGVKITSLGNASLNAVQQQPSSGAPTLLGQTHYFPVGATVTISQEPQPGTTFQVTGSGPSGFTPQTLSASANALRGKDVPALALQDTGVSFTARSILYKTINETQLGLLGDAAMRGQHLPFAAAALSVVLQDTPASTITVPGAAPINLPAPSTTLSNSTLTGNTANGNTTTGSGIVSNGSGPTVGNSVVGGNTNGVASSNTGSGTVANNTVSGNTTGTTVTTPGATTPVVTTPPSVGTTPAIPAAPAGVLTSESGSQLAVSIGTSAGGDPELWGFSVLGGLLQITFVENGRVLADMKGDINNAARVNPSIVRLTGETGTVFGNPVLSHGVNSGMHIAFGPPVPAGTFPTGGTFAYNFVATTPPTYSNGATLPGALTGSAVVDFTSLKVGVAMTATMPDQTYTIQTPGGTANPAASTVGIGTFTGGQPFHFGFGGYTTSPVTCPRGCRTQIGGHFYGVGATFTSILFAADFLNGVSLNGAALGKR